MSEKKLFKIVLASVIFNQEGKILLGKRSEDEDVLPGYWGLPGGNIHTIGNIQNVLQEELKREILEEVGIRIDNLTFLENHSHESGKINICFMSNHLSGKAKALDETEEVKWLDFSKIKEFKLTPHTFERIELAINLRSK